MEYMVAINSYMRRNGADLYRMASIAPTAGGPSLLLRYWVSKGHEPKTILQRGHDAAKRAELSAQWVKIDQERLASGYKLDQRLGGSLTTAEILKSDELHWIFSTDRVADLLSYLNANEIADPDEEPGKHEFAIQALTALRNNQSVNTIAAPAKAVAAASPEPKADPWAGAADFGAWS